MTPLLQQFADAFNKAGDCHDLVFRSATDDSPALVIAAASKETGDLSIHDDGDELTVVIGELHHSHFSGYSYDGDSDEARLARVAEEAAAFVAEVLADRIRITVRYKGSQCIGSSAKHVVHETSMGKTVSYPLSAWWFRETRQNHFLWSGPIR